MNHYPAMIPLFGAPNGVCLSITEAKHIKAVKEPWCWSNRNKPLKQMLYTNQCLNKLAAARVNFMQRGILSNSKLNASLKLIGFLYILSKCCSILTNVAKQIQKTFNNLEEPKGTGKHAEDALEIVDDSIIFACTELGKLICISSFLF